jgi:hypothetical protein
MMDIYEELIKVINNHINEIDKYIDFIDITLKKLTDNKVKSENISKSREHLEQLKKYIILSVNERKNYINE